jgi:hypothetical protein
MPKQATSFESAKGELSEKFERGKQTATEVVHDARDEIAQKVGEYTEKAKDAVLKGAESTQRDLSSSLLALSGALRAASEHLANSDQRAASKFILDAAGGMERMSASIRDKPVADVLEEVRSFGRDNSGALIAGSVLAGLALGRFVKSATPGTSAGRRPESGASDALDQGDEGEPTGGYADESLGADGSLNP